MVHEIIYDIQNDAYFFNGQTGTFKEIISVIRNMYATSTIIVTTVCDYNYSKGRLQYVDATTREMAQITAAYKDTL